MSTLAEQEPEMAEKPMPRVRIVNRSKTSGPGARAGYMTKVFIDDVDISGCIESVQVDAHRKGIVTATLGVVVNEVEVEDHMELRFLNEARELLIKHGWTPPAQDH